MGFVRDERIDIDDGLKTARVKTKIFRLDFRRIFKISSVGRKSDFNAY